MFSPSHGYNFSESRSYFVKLNWKLQFGKSQHYLRKLAMKLAYLTKAKISFVFFTIGQPLK